MISSFSDDEYLIRGRPQPRSYFFSAAAGRVPARQQPPSACALPDAASSPRRWSPLGPCHPPGGVCRLRETPSTSCSTGSRRCLHGGTAQRRWLLPAGRPAQCGSSLPPNTACGSPGGCLGPTAPNATLVWWISGSSSLLRRYDRPEILHSSIHPSCLIGADVGHWSPTRETEPAPRPDRLPLFGPERGAIRRRVQPRS